MKGILSRVKGKCFLGNLTEGLNCYFGKRLAKANLNLASSLFFQGENIQGLLLFVVVAAAVDGGVVLFSFQTLTLKRLISETSFSRQQQPRVYKHFHGLAKPRFLLSDWACLLKVVNSVR